MCSSPACVDGTEEGGGGGKLLVSFGIDPPDQLSISVIFQGGEDASAAGSELSLSNLSARRGPQIMLLPLGSTFHGLKNIFKTLSHSCSWVAQAGVNRHVLHTSRELRFC